MWLEALQLIFSLHKPVFLVLANAIEVTGFAIIIALVIGIPLGVLSGFHRFPFQRFVLFLLHLWMFAPMLALGIFLYFVHAQTMISPTGYILWGALLVIPYFSSLIADAFYGVKADSKTDIIALGANRWQMYNVFVRENSIELWGAVSAGVARIFAEVGAFFLILGYRYELGFPSKPVFVLKTASENLAVALMLFMIGGVVYLGIHFIQFSQES